MGTYYPPQGVRWMLITKPIGSMPAQGIIRKLPPPKVPPEGELFKLDYGRLDIDYLG